MPLRAAPCLLAALILSVVPARAEDPAVAAAPEAARIRADALPLASGASSGDPALRLGAAGAPTRAFREHAPIAYFSLGALAVGGVFYGIHSHPGPAGVRSVSGNGSRVGMALGAAAFTSAAAGAAYLYYAFAPDRRAPAWTGGLSGAVAPDGSVAASVTVPLSALAD